MRPFEISKVFLELKHSRDGGCLEVSTSSQYSMSCEFEKSHFKSLCPVCRKVMALNPWSHDQEAVDEPERESLFH